VGARFLEVEDKFYNRLFSSHLAIPLSFEECVYSISSSDDENFSNWDLP